MNEAVTATLTFTLIATAIILSTGYIRRWVTQ